MVKISLQFIQKKDKTIICSTSQEFMLLLTYSKLKKRSKINISTRKMQMICLLIFNITSQNIKKLQLYPWLLASTLNPNSIMLNSQCDNTKIRKTVSKKPISTNTVKGSQNMAKKINNINKNSKRKNNRMQMRQLLKRQKRSLNLNWLKKTFQVFDEYTYFILSKFTQINLKIFFN